jgi:hypothetical protein
MIFILEKVVDITVVYLCEVPEHHKIFLMTKMQGCRKPVKFCPEL